MNRVKMQNVKNIVLIAHDSRKREAHLHHGA